MHDLKVPINDMLQKLKYSPSKEAAMQLGRTGADEAVSELINMVECSIRISHPTETRYVDSVYKPNWWNKKRIRKEKLSYTPMEYYEEDTQLIGVEALGETRSERALEYLEKVENHKGPIEEMEDHCMGGYYMTGKFYDADFPNAPGNLKYCLGRSLAEIKECEAKEFNIFTSWCDKSYLILKSAIEKLEITSANEIYEYKHFKPFAWKGAYADGYRVNHFEKENITYAILHPSQPYDDDSMLLRWDSNKNRWTKSFQLGLLTCNGFPEGSIIRNGTDPDERASLVLLGYFALEDRAEEFTPEKVGYLHPWVLENL